MALDLRHLRPEQAGTGTYAIGLARALGALPEIELTMIVRHRRPSGKRAQVGSSWSAGPCRMLMSSTSRPRSSMPPTLNCCSELRRTSIITHLDLIAYRAQFVFSNQEAASRYRATCALALSAAQMTIVLSEDARREMIAEFGLPPEAVAVTPLGVELDGHNPAAGDGQLAVGDFVPRGRFFLSVATDFPHKNLRNLIDAFTLLRRQWSFPGDPPGLVLVGSKTSIRDGCYRHLAADPLPGVTYLGAVSDRRLRALYRSAEAFIFTSVYEGFGLPILEAMAAGTPVIALPISSVPEVGGDAVLYADGTAPLDLVRALERLATDQSLRDELRQRGRLRATEFQWERTARLTLAAYRSTVFQPPERSLRARRLLLDVVSKWADGGRSVPAYAEPGIRNAWSDLNRGAWGPRPSRVRSVSVRPRQAIGLSQRGPRQSHDRRQSRAVYRKSLPASIADNR